MMSTWDASRQDETDLCFVLIALEEEHSGVQTGS